jgi:transcriptional regulator with XRE-family HTH domain
MSQRAALTSEDGIGTRIRRFRRARGLSLDQAAGLAGISKAYLSRLERGERSIDSRALLLCIATALEISVGDLTGHPHVPLDREQVEARRAVPGVRMSLLDSSEGPAVAVPDAQLAAAVDSLTRALQSCDLIEQGRLLPDLLRQTQSQALADGSAASLCRLVVVAHGATFFLRNIGEIDLAVIAAERMSLAAQRSDDPALQAFAAYTQAHALAPAGAVRRAAELAVHGAVAHPCAEDRELLAAQGSCFLVAASSSATLGEYDRARDLLKAAGELSARVGSPTLVGEHTSFSDWNVAMHRVTVEVDAGNPVRALEAAKPLMAARIGQRERMSYMWVDAGRAFAQLDRHREAVDAFRRAERAAPLRVHLSPVVRESVRELVDGAVRPAAGVELRGLAERCGVLAGD